MDIVKIVESLPDNVKNLIVSALLNSSVALKNTEQDFRAVDDISAKTKQEYRKSSNRLLESMRRGEHNEQYVKYFYEVLKKADDLVYNSTPEQLKQLAEKYGMGENAQTQFNFLNETHLQKHGNKNVDTIRKDEIKKRVTTDDNFPIEKIITNKRNLKNVLEHASGSKGIYNYTIKIKRKNDIENKIEEISDYLHVKELGIENNGRILEFFIPKKYELENLDKNTVLFSELKNVDYVSFADDYGQKYEYSIKSFYRISENGMYDVFKFKGVKIENIGIIR